MNPAIAFRIAQLALSLAQGADADVPASHSCCRSFRAPVGHIRITPENPSIRA